MARSDNRRNLFHSSRRADSYGVAWAYVRYGSLPQAARLLYGVKPVIIAIVLQALGSLARTAAKTKFLTVIGVLAAVLSFLRLNELLVLFSAGAVVALVRLARDFGKGSKKRLVSLTSPFAFLIQVATNTEVTTPLGLLPLFSFF